MRVALLGRTQMLLDTAALLAEGGHQIVCIATCRPRGPNALGVEAFEQAARAYGAPFVLTQQLDAPSVVDQLVGAQAAVGVSVDWVTLIGPHACAAFEHGILNAHAGDLPRYRGNSPIPWAMLNGDPHIGVVVHRMSPLEFDAGPIVARAYLAMTQQTYVSEVFAFVEDQVPRLFRQAVDDLAAGTARFIPQSASGIPPLRCYPRIAADGLIQWSDSAEMIARLVRATARPYEGAFTRHDGSRLTVWRAEPRAWEQPSLAVPGQCVFRNAATGEVGIATGDGVLCLQEVERDGLGPRPASAVITTTRTRLGLVAT